MVFSDLFFLFAFLPSFALMYVIAQCVDVRHSKEEAKPSFTWRNAALVLFSLIFYSWGEPVYVGLMILCVVINYFAGLGVASSRNPRCSLAVGIALNLVLLGAFKYLGFFGEIFSSLGIAVALPNVALPIGISFYVFQSISYLVDVSRKEAPVQRNFFSLLLYISLFPQLIAGPIVRYGTIAHEIHDRKITGKGLSEGIERFLIGLAKKVIFANMFSEIADQFLLQGNEPLTFWKAWIGIIAFALQIYYDFSGYSDMAIGIGRGLGFHFNENFNHPYCCTSVTDFWRRWHMSLGSFFRDYVYIPMGGNRRHQIYNLLTVWFLTGMWHGASWNFIFWGLYYGLVLIIEKYTLRRYNWNLLRPMMHIYSLMFVVLGWIFFYYTDLSQVGHCFRAVAGMNGFDWTFVEEAAIFDYFWIWVMGLLFCMPIRASISNYITSRIESREGAGTLTFSIVRAAISVSILVICVALLVGATNNAFIYTRF